MKNGLFVAEGYKTIVDLLDSDIKAVGIYGKADVLEKIKLTDGTELFEVSANELKKISFLSTSSNVLGLFKIPEINIEDCFANDFLITLDGVQDPGNLGTIVRLADWFGVKNIVCSPDCVDVYNPKTVQSTMGSIVRVKVHYTDLPGFLQKANTEKYQIYGSFMNGKSIYETSFLQKRILIMGSEGQGISKEVAQFVDERISIPAFFEGGNGPESLNVAVASSIIVSEMKRSILR